MNTTAKDTPYLRQSLGVKSMTQRLDQWLVSDEGVEFEDQVRKEGRAKFEDIRQHPLPLGAAHAHNDRKRRRILNPVDINRQEQLVREIIDKEIKDKPKIGTIARLRRTNYLKLNQKDRVKQGQLVEILGRKLCYTIYSKRHNI